ncbi:MAG: lipopolysaccharide assembly protein LapA domain-containing protein [Sphingosinicella sp.]|uniref:lipopolysaccharide assembly protein LapA domain-containing protein n=1 Tax=Sphingosinicella sp. TaxID=1917971 RepID=UPI004038297D
MEAFSLDQWLVLLLAFVLGLILGMAFLASPKWKRRWREENERVRELEAENAQLRKDAAEMDSLRHAAARDEARHDDRDRPGPL